MKNKDARASYRYCKTCSRMLGPSYKGDYCPLCEENRLFDKVREFIRANDVTEYQVAAHFGIPQKKVKEWIKEGRIEYKEKEVKEIVSLRCENCGAPLSFGTLCRKCRRVLEGDKYEYAGDELEEMKMRFLDKDDSE